MDQQEKKPFYKKKWFIGLAIFFGIGLIGTIFDDKPPRPVTTSTPEVRQEAPKETTTPKSTLSKEEAQKEFDRLMDLSKQSGLVKSYEMSDTLPLKIFVSNVWYTQEVSFKKDMIAKFSMLEQAIYGRHRLEVRDAYSNEKVAEVTAFSGSFEVYK